MTKPELHIVAILSGIFALRMLGVGMLLPIFAVEALQYSSANAQLIGLAVGIYGLAQAVLQVPFGMLSDRCGRKPLLLIGLGMIVSGSLISMWSTSIYGLILGRLLQGCGSIGSVVLATLSDNVSAQSRTSSMAILGASIGLAFALALVAGPGLNQWFGLTGVFAVTAILAGVCSGLVLLMPTQNITVNENNWLLALSQTFTRQLFKLNFGVFVLHANLAALFLILPTILQQSGVVASKLWQFYFGAIVVAMLVVWRLIAHSERKQNIEQLQRLAILSLLFAEGLLYTVSNSLGITVSLVIFFSAFCLLEASLPALVAKYAVANNRGTALGMYACLQFLGVFVGGVVGGWLHEHFGAMYVLSFCVLMVLSWFIVNINRTFTRGVKWQEV